MDSNNPTQFDGTFAKPHKPNAKANFCKEPPTQRTTKRHYIADIQANKAEGRHLTAILRNGGFRAKL